MRDGTRHQLLLIILCGVVYLTNLGATRLWDEDEARFGSTAREMAQRNDLVVPYFNGEISLHKPALASWVMIAACRIFGFTEFAMRIGSVVFAIGNVLLTYHLGRRLFSRRVGLWSGLVLASSLHFVLIARAAVSDQELMFFCTLPIFVFVCSTRLGRDRTPAESESGALLSDSEPILPTDVPWSRWILTYACMGVGALVKGPVAILLPSAVIGLFLLMSLTDARTAHRLQAAPPPTRRRAVLHWWAVLIGPLQFLKTAWQMRPVTLVLTAGLVAAPWYVAVGQATDGEWLRGFFLVHNVGRFSRSFEGHAGGLLYYIVAICVGTFPWCIFLFQSIQTMAAEMRRGLVARGPLQLLAGWVIVWVAAFTMASTKLPHYILPAYPALAVIFGVFVTRWLEGMIPVTQAWMRLAFGNMILIGVGTMIVVPIVASMFVPGEQRLAVIGLVPLVGGVVAFRAQQQGRHQVAAVSLVCIGALLSLTVFAWAAVRVDRYQSSPVVGEWLQELEESPRSSRFATFGFFDSCLVYYVDRRTVEMGNPVAVGRMFANENRPTYVLTTDEHLKRLQPHLPQGVGVIRETPRFLRPGRLLLIGQRTTEKTSAERIASEADSTIVR